MQNTAMLMPTSHFYYVYILRDVATGKHHYTGVTHDLQERLAMHNAGHVPHTSKFAPWYIETAIAFRDKEKAFAYERYLKTGADRAYAIKHF
jgi:predicted GIY-YIG superfamily endonuclease